MKVALGLMLGVTLGIVFAPGAGAETRRRILAGAKTLLRAPHDAANEIAEKTREKAGDIGARVGRDAAQAAVSAIQREVIGG
jgi:hypothetical protein